MIEASVTANNFIVFKWKISSKVNGNFDAECVKMFSGTIRHRWQLICTQCKNLFFNLHEGGGH